MNRYPTAALEALRSERNSTLNREGMRYYRSARPKARRTYATAITHSGGSQTIYTCICGARHTAATRHRGQTLHEAVWNTDHADCAQAWIPLGLA